MRARASLVLILVFAAGCSRPLPTRPLSGTAVPRPATSPSFVPAPRIEPARILPDLHRGLVPAGLQSDGSRLHLHLRMRLLERPDGSVQRAPGLLPAGRSRILALQLPDRLGSGFLFAASSASSTQLWKATSWLAALNPILRVEQPIEEIVAGSDRVYLRNTRAAQGFIAIDPADGTVLQSGALPQPARYGPVVFADGWRGVAVVDLRGAMATFDAGMTWVPLGVHEPVRTLSTVGDRIVLGLDNARYALDSQGTLTAHGWQADESTDETRLDGARSTAERLFNDRPLRVAIARGVPLTKSIAVFAHRGHLGFVSTTSGSLIRVIRDAYPSSYTECQGVRLGTGIGFVCGQRQGATAVFSFKPPSSFEPVLRYRQPHAVFASGNGAIVVRAPCPGAEPIRDQAQYCLRDPSGKTRELRFQGDLGAERVVPLSDGRVMVLVAPRPGAEGRVVVLHGNRAITHTLSLDELSRRQRALIRRGLWMHGATEVSPGVVGLWVEAGGPVLGIRVDHTGRVSAGAVQSHPGSVFVSANLGIVWRNHGSGLETTDGGLSWKEFDLPAGQADGDSTFRGCSAVGCIVDGWLRVGWGRSTEADDLEPVRESASRFVPRFSTARARSFTCSATGRSSPPPVPAPAAVPRPALPPPHRYPGAPLLTADPRTSSWLPFDAAPAPTLGRDEVGFGAGRDYGEFRFRAYAWGPKSADWTRSGRWVLRFDDAFNAIAAPYASATAVPPWVDLSAASLRFNSVRTALLDPGGRSAVVGLCPVSNQCQVFGVSADEVPVELTLDSGGSWPLLTSMTRTREAWYLLGPSGGNTTTLYVADRTGHARALATYPRVRNAAHDDVVLVRRVHTDAVALSLRSYQADGASSLVLMPLDTKTGEVLDALPVLHPRDGEEQPAKACTDGQEGWLIEKPFVMGPVLRMPDGTAFGGSIREQWVVEGPRLCVRALAARATAAEVARTRQGPATASAMAGAVPLSVWDQGELRKYELSCLPVRP